MALSHNKMIKRPSSRADAIIKMLSSKFHSQSTFKKIIRQQRNDDTFDLYWTKKIHHHQLRGISTTYEPTQELTSMLKEAEVLYLMSLDRGVHDFEISHSNFQVLRQRDKTLMMNSGMSKNTINGIPGWSVKNNTKDDQIRHYSTFTSMSSEARNLTSYCSSYDISAALQTFAINFIKEHQLPGTFEVIEYYIQNADNKNKVRQQLADEIGGTINDAKRIITMLFYGASVQQALSEYKQQSKTGFFLKIKQEASDITQLISDNLNLIEDYEFEVYLKHRQDNRSTSKSGRRKNKKGIRVFSFLEYNERKIKDILDPDDIGQDVHDAVYFKDVPEDIEARIEEIKNTFNVSVEAE